MRTVIAGERPRELEDLIARRHALGQDLFDEVWEGDYHMAPGPSGKHSDLDDQLAAILRPLANRVGLHGGGPCNIGTADNYRVPDRAYFAERPSLVFNPSAQVVVEIVSPGDESRLKSDFYFRVGVEELLIVDPEQRTVEWFVRGDTAFVAADGSRLLDLSAAHLADLIDWP